MLEQAQGFRDESEALHALIAPLSAGELEAETQFKAWTINDVVAHLHVFNLAAAASLEGEAAFKAFSAPMMEAILKGGSMRAAAREWCGETWGPALREAWRAGVAETAERFGAADPSERLKWFGPDMSVRSSITARLMETWAHGQAVYDLLGETRVDADRIGDIVHLGVRTYAWSFQVRGETPPEPVPHVRLVAPSGAIWKYNDENAEERVEGAATEFCQVVTQTRNVADTALRVIGPNAAAWMARAQCFAGPPVGPPAAGTRYRGER